jgi:hypothetical protein
MAHPEEAMSGLLWVMGTVHLGVAKPTWLGVPHSCFYLKSFLVYPFFILEFQISFELKKHSVVKYKFENTVLHEKYNRFF